MLAILFLCGSEKILVMEKEFFFEYKEYLITQQGIEIKRQNVKLVQALTELLDVNHFVSNEVRIKSEKKIIELLSII